VYDAVNCPQQKCLIHLMRDINDDLYRHPYDEDVRSIATEYARLIRPMIETIDKHGLKKRFLTSHVSEVEKFFRWLAAEQFDSETALGYQRRFEKNRGKLFTFLAHDGVPWNNNNAENAIRAFAELRRVAGGAWTEKGLREYLVLLSVCETCKRRGINFLHFMLSGGTNIEESAAGRSSQFKTVRERERQPKEPQRSPRRSSTGRKSDLRVPEGVSLERRDDCHPAQVTKQGEPRPRHKDQSSDGRKLEIVRVINDRRKVSPAKLLGSLRQLPVFPDVVTYIANQLAFRRQDGQVTYFNGQVPVFSHAETDIATFRMITSQFCVTGQVKQRDIIRAFGVTSISVKRSVKIYREKGPKGFYAPRVTRGPGVLVEAVVSEIEGRLMGGPLRQRSPKRWD
jgi:hypothetical protein